MKQEQDELLIKFVRSHSILYDAAHVNFKNSILKHKIWEEIAQILEISVADVKKRWKYLRDHYKKKEKDIAAGQAINQCTWEYMSQLKFLTQVQSQRSTTTNEEVSVELPADLNTQNEPEAEERTLETQDIVIVEESQDLSETQFSFSDTPEATASVDGWHLPAACVGSYGFEAFQRMDFMTDENKMKKEQDELLIKLVRRHSILYDPAHVNFRSNILKHIVWEEIAKMLQIPVADVKKRWKHIRDHYKKKEKDIATGQAINQRNTWEYMSQLTFLTQVHSQRSTVTNEEEEASVELLADLNTQNEPETEERTPEIQDIVEESQDLSETQKSIEDNLDSQQSFSPSTKKLKTSDENALVSILEKRQKVRDQLFGKILTQTEIVPEKSAIHKFFECMADTVSNFPPHLIAETRLQVCKIVTEMEVKIHNEQWRTTATASFPPTSSGTPMQSNDSCDS
uniref:Uncharacterized protein LOC114330605 n=1 Tax=Diabrotica virgifera virgifera TaxID=50390 RepID=A0A6P7FSP3_DIAVI